MIAFASSFVAFRVELVSKELKYFRAYVQYVGLCNLSKSEL